jgi:HEAT repeat protein
MSASVQELGECIGKADDPIGKRNRAIYMLKHIASHDAVSALISAFPTESVLVNHEICYALGQLQNRLA